MVFMLPSPQEIHKFKPQTTRPTPLLKFRFHHCAEEIPLGVHGSIPRGDKHLP